MTELYNAVRGWLGLVEALVVVCAALALLVVPVTVAGVEYRRRRP